MTGRLSRTALTAWVILDESLGATQILGLVLIVVAVAAVVADGSVRTYDMLKLRGGPQAIAHGAATTTQMTDAIIAAL